MVLELITLNDDIKAKNNHQHSHQTDKSNLFEKLESDYDGEVANIIEKAIDVTSDNIFGTGVYQLISFFFLGFTWTVGNGWITYSTVFSGKQ
jgi:hypothetical protein